jgi:hypothetical protein
MKSVRNEINAVRAIISSCSCDKEVVGDGRMPRQCECYLGLFLSNLASLITVLTGAAGAAVTEEALGHRHQSHMRDSF